MRMNEIDFSGPPPIDGYGPGGFRISSKWHAGSLLILPRAVESISDIDHAAIARLTAQAGEIDLVVVGQGADVAPFDRDLRACLDAAQIGIEVMSTPSACRTYNVLLTEGRRVAACLIAL